MFVSCLLLSLAALPVLASSTSNDASAEAASDPLAQSAHFNCKFKLHGLEFDICELVHSTPKYIYHHEDTPPTHTTTLHSISLRGPLKYNESIAREHQCPDGTWICFKKWNSIPGEENSHRLLEVIPIASEKFIAPPPPPKEESLLETHDHLNVSISLGDQVTWEKHPPVVISLHGGQYAGNKHSAVVGFMCDEEIPGLNHPTLAKWSGNTWHFYEWRTKHACPLNGWNSHVHKAKPGTRYPDPLHGGSKSVKSTWFWIGTIIFFGFASHVLYRFLRSGGAHMDTGFIVTSLAALPQALLYLPSLVFQQAQACLGRRRRAPRPEHAQLLWADEDEDEPHVPRHSIGKGSSIPGFGIDEEDVAAWSPPSPSRARFSGPYPPTYGVATPRSPPVVQGSGGSVAPGSVLGKAVDFVKSKF